jgi:hypothetical protein
MRKLSLYGIIGLLVSMAGYMSCSKVNGIDNSNVIETPYSLYFSDTAGTLYSSNDGKAFSVVFPADGFPSRAICTVNSNILWAKTNMYVSTNNGLNFNHAYDSLASYPFGSCAGLGMNLNQSMIVNVSDWGMVYCVSSSPAFNDYLGVVFSLNVGGIAGSWWFDTVDSLNQIGGTYGPGITTMTSYAYLPNGVLCGYDGIHNRNFYRIKTSLWNECTPVPDTVTYPGLGDQVGNKNNHSGIWLPHNNIVEVPFGAAADTSSRYSIGHYNNRLVAIDNKGCNPGIAYYSDDTGRTWLPFYGLPQKPALCVYSPFDEICLVGTDSAGLYVLNNNTNTFYVNNNGLASNLIVRNITCKENIYKNGRVVKYVYLATNKGIYQSVDGGNNWTQTIPGNFVTIY